MLLTSPPVEGECREGAPVADPTAPRQDAPLACARSRADGLTIHRLGRRLVDERELVIL